MDARMNFYQWSAWLIAMNNTMFTVPNLNKFLPKNARI